MSCFALHCCAVGLIVLFSVISITYSVNHDFTPLSYKVVNVKVTPRRNLWATGHFMGKKSFVDSASHQPQDNWMRTVELDPDFYQEAQKTFKRTQLDPQESRNKITDAATLMKVFENYVKDNRQ